MMRAAGTALLALVWLAISGSWTLPNLALGAIVGFLCLAILGNPGAGDAAGQGTPSARRIRVGALVVLAMVLVREIILSAWRVARLVTARDLDGHAGLAPAVISYPLKLERDFEIALLANLITLTPGTLSVDVSQDRRTLLVHAIDGADPAATCAEIEATFEQRIARAFPA